MPKTQSQPDVTANVVTHMYPAIESVEVTRGQKGGYGWTIKAASPERAQELDADLRQRFGEGTE